MNCAVCGEHAFYQERCTRCGCRWAVCLFHTVPNVERPCRCSRHFSGDQRWKRESIDLQSEAEWGDRESIDFSMEEEEVDYEVLLNSFRSSERRSEDDLIVQSIQRERLLRLRSQDNSTLSLMATCEYIAKNDGVELKSMSAIPQLPQLGCILSEKARRIILEKGPPKVLFLTSSDSVKDEEASIESLYQKDGHFCGEGFSAEEFFARCGVNGKIKNLIIMLDQLGNFSLFQQHFINRNTFLILSARAVSRNKQDLLGRIKSNNANLVLIRPDNTIGQVRKDGKNEGGHNINDDLTYLHSKSITVIGEEHGVVIWGSPNWTLFGLEKNAEFMIVDSSPDAVCAELMSLWKYIQYLSKKLGAEKCILESGAAWMYHFENDFLSNEQCGRYKAFRESNDHKDKVGKVLGRILSERTPKERKRVWQRMKSLDYYAVSDCTIAIYTLPILSAIDKYNILEGDRKRVGSEMAYFIRAMLGSAKSCIAISAMSIFDRGDDLILEKLLELLKGKPDLKLKLLVDSKWAGMESDEKEEILGLKQAIDCFSGVVGEDKVSLYSNDTPLNPVQEESRVEIYTAGKKGQGEWTFHSKMVVIDNDCALFTTANIKQSGNWGGLSVLNKYYFTRKPAWVNQAIMYLNTYFYWTKASLAKK